MIYCNKFNLLQCSNDVSISISLILIGINVKYLRKIKTNIIYVNYILNTELKY